MTGCERLFSEAVLQPGMAELVNRSDRAQDITVAGILEEVHEADRSSPAGGKLRKRKAG